MGQYYKPINLDKQEFVLGHDYGSGIKLMEHAWLLTPFMNVLTDLLKPGAPWHKDRIVWAGDYMDNGIFMDDITGKRASDDTLYSCSCDNGDGSLPCIKKVNPKLQDGPLPTLLVNHSNQTFVNLLILPKEVTTWIIHPLPLLTCSGNGRGGGDYRRFNKYVGTWAGHSISTEYTKPHRYKEIKPNFTEKQTT